MKINKFLLGIFPAFVIPCLFGCNSGGKDEPTKPTPVDFTISENEVYTVKDYEKRLEIKLGSDVDANKVDISWNIKDQSKIKEVSRTSDNLLFTFKALEDTEEGKPTELVVRIDAKDKSDFKEQTCFITILKELPKYNITYKNIIYYDEETGEKTWEDYKSESVEYGSKLTKPDDPTTTLPDLYDFAGWYLDENWTTQFDFTTLIKSDLTLYACYARNDQKVVALVSPDKEYSYELVKQGNLCPKPSDPIKRGYNFLGWYLEDQLFDFTKTPINESMVLYGKDKLIEYKITYDYDEGELPTGKSNPTSYNVTTEKTDLIASEKTHYIFYEYIDNKKNPITSIGGGEIGDLNITATYTAKKYKITYHNIDGLENPNPTSYTIENSFTFEPVEKYGYFFDAWYTDPEFKNPIEEIEYGSYGDIDVYAKFKDYVNMSTCEWSVIIDAANEYESGKISEEQFANKFGDPTYGYQYTEGKDMIEVIRTITLNNQSHKVRIIGFNQDVDENNNKLALTFEFANLISDKNGNSLAYQWIDAKADKTNNEHYTDSSIRKILCGNGGYAYDVLCSTSSVGGDWDNEYKNKTILSMFPEDIRNSLKTVKKKVGEGSDYKLKEYTDKLFMLSMAEMNSSFEAHEGGLGSYTYYQFYMLVNCAVKKQVNNSVVSTKINTIGSSHGQQCAVSVNATCGYNSTTGGSGGGAYWLRTPHSTGQSMNHYCSYFMPCDKASIEKERQKQYDYNTGFLGRTYNNAYGIAPAFCF